jgi:maltokinase
VTDPLDGLDLPGGARLAIVGDGVRRSAIPMVQRTGWRRAAPGDGASQALVDLLAEQPGTRRIGRFTVRSWLRPPAARTARTERAVGVDQTNESVIVGETAVVKWATHLQEAPHPAPRRITALRAAGFTGMPAPWGLVTWVPPEGSETVVAYVDDYVAGAADGWTWAVDMVTAAAGAGRPQAVRPEAQALGTLIADMHAAVASTTAVATEADVLRWHSSALTTLETACALGDFPSVHTLNDHCATVRAELEVLRTCAGATTLDGHGDLHVGQVLRGGGRFLVTDFDGNPVLSPAERVAPIPAAVDVAGIVQSLVHAAIVARRYTDLDETIVQAVGAVLEDTFLDTYVDRLEQHGCAGLYDPRPLRALRLVQVMREMIYATAHLPRWMYVPDAALSALLGEETTP